MRKAFPMIAALFVVAALVLGNATGRWQTARDPGAGTVLAQTATVMFTDLSDAQQRRFALALIDAGLALHRALENKAKKAQAFLRWEAGAADETERSDTRKAAAVAARQISAEIVAALRSLPTPESIAAAFPAGGEGEGEGELAARGGRLED